MKVYRIAKKIYADDLSGEGAGLFGGRWNMQGVPCIYAASSRSLAILELSVNTSKDDMPDDLMLLTIELPDELIQQIDVRKLPENWQTHPISTEARKFGSELLHSKKFLAYFLPSAVVPQEYNIIINPLHPKIKQVRITDMQPLKLDGRIKE